MAVKKQTNQKETVDLSDTLPVFTSAEEYLLDDKNNRKTFRKILNEEEVTPKELVGLIDEGKNKSLIDNLIEEIPYMIGFTPKSIIFFTILSLFENIIGTGHDILILF